MPSRLFTNEQNVMEIIHQMQLERVVNGANPPDVLDT